MVRIQSMPKLQTFITFNGHYQVLNTRILKPGSFFVKDPNAPPPPPSAPSIPASVQNNNCSPKISWNSVSNATGYKVYRAFNNPGGTYGKIATISATSYTDSSQQIWSCDSTGPKESVYYKVKAYNNGGESSFSNTASGTVKEEIY